jgi:hypothetical protein
MVDKPNKNLEAYKKITGGYVPTATPKDATGMTGVGITGTNRDIAKEMEASTLGYSPQYIASRGGINSQGYFNDTPLSGQLTASEQQSVTLPNGTVNTQAMADILQKKQIDELVAKGMSKSDATAQVSAQYGKFGVPLATGGTGGTGGTSGAGGVGGLKTDAQIKAETLSAEKRAERQSAYDLLFEQFNQYGLGALVEPLKGLIISGSSPSEFTIRLRETDAYKKRFAANAARIQKGLTAISEAEYLGLEDQYQNIMRNYGLPADYYTRGDMGRQEGFEKFIANDVSAAELEDRVMTAQNRVMNSNPEVLQAIKDFYGDSITNGDILAYTLNPTKGLEDIKRKVTAAEIGGAAVQAGLNLGRTAEERALYAARAAELGAAGITKQQAQQGFQTVAEVAPRGGQLAEIYKQNPYTQTTAEAEVFGLAGSTEAARQRKKLTSLETAAFSGSAGAGAIARDRAGVL